VEGPSDPRFWRSRYAEAPFTVDAAELERLFARRFVLMQMTAPGDSIERRRGQELLAHFRRL